MKEKKNRKSMAGRLRALFSEEMGEYLGEPHIEWRGSGFFMIDGAVRIHECTPQRIAVKLARGSLTVEGEELVCRSFINRTLVIGGSICSVVFCKGGGA